MAKGTTPTQIRLTDEDKSNADVTRDRWGLPSRAAAIRYALKRVREEDDRNGAAHRKKSAKTP